MVIIRVLLLKTRGNIWFRIDLSLNVSNLDRMAHQGFGNKNWRIKDLKKKSNCEKIQIMKKSNILCDLNLNTQPDNTTRVLTEVHIWRHIRAGFLEPYVPSRAAHSILNSMITC